MASQKKPRVKAVRISSGGLSAAMATMARMGNQREFDFPERLHGFANAVNFAAKAEQRRVQISAGAYSPGKGRY
jgi:hypothetical protein